MISFFLKLGSEDWIHSDLASLHVEYVKVGQLAASASEEQSNDFDVFLRR
jgi:hypothetical protein